MAVCTVPIMTSALHHD